MLTNQTHPKPQYKFSIFLATLYMTVNVCIPILSNKIIANPFSIMSVSNFISPFWYVLGDIIAETYGFAMIMRFFWSLVASEISFDLLCYVLINSPSPKWYGHETHNTILGHLLPLNIWSVIAIAFAWRINAYLLLKWKALTRGRFFWLRSVGSSAIGEVLFTTFMSPAIIIFGPAKDFRQALILYIMTCFMRVIGTAFFALPGSLVVRILKLIEKVDIYDQQLLFNPFKKVQKLENP